MRIFLVRHGESVANVDKSLHHKIADHAIPLSERGLEQAREAGRFLSEYFKKELSVPVQMPRKRLWHSPYVRTRQTAAMILPWIRGHSVDVREHLLLAEQQFGIFDGYTDEELAVKFPHEFRHYQKCKEFEGGFWAGMPLGESKFDLSVRVHQAFGTFQRDASKHGINDLIVVAHGSTNRAFVMMWLHLGFEWFEKEPNPKNCSIRLIEDNADRGYIYQ